MGEEGFSSDSSLLYHRTCPRRSSTPAPWELPDQATAPNEPLLPRHLKLHDLFGDGVEGSDAVTGRRLVLGNGDVRISLRRRPASPRRSTATPSATSACTSRPAAACVETVFGAPARSAPATT